MRRNISLCLVALLAYCCCVRTSSYYDSDQNSYLGKGTEDSIKRSKFPSRAFARDDIPLRTKSTTTDTSYSNYYEEEYPYGEPPPSEFRSIPKVDIVKKYTSEASSRIIVAVSAAITSGLLVHLLTAMIISHSSIIITSIASMGAIFYTFHDGDLGDLCRSLGVLTILLFTRARLKQFITTFVSQSKGMLMLGERRNFPPFTENPWKYIPIEGEDDLEFKMMNAIIGLVISGAFIGWRIAKMIPFFPGWIGAIGGASVLGYGGTFRDGRGDMLRFIGHSLHSLVREISQTMDDVSLREKLGVVLAQFLSFLRNLDEKLGIMEKLQVLLAELMKLVKALVGSARSTGDDSEDAAARGKRARPAKESSGNGRRYGSTDTGPFDEAEEDPYGAGLGTGLGEQTYRSRKSKYSKYSES